MALNTQNHHILPTDVYSYFEDAIARWTGADGNDNPYKNNAGYNRIELPKDTSGSLVQSGLPGHNGSHPGLNTAWRNVLKDISTKVGNGEITNAQAGQMFTNAHAHFRGALDLSGTQTDHPFLLNNNDPEVANLDAVTNTDGTVIDPKNGQGTLSSWVVAAHNPEAVQQSAAAQRAEAGVSDNQSYNSQNGDNRNFPSSQAYRDAYGIGDNAFDPVTGRIITKTGEVYNPAVDASATTDNSVDTTTGTGDGIGPNDGSNTGTGDGIGPNDGSNTGTGVLPNGIGGAIRGIGLGDLAEFGNVAYEDFLHGVETGDWSGFIDKAGQYALLSGATMAAIAGVALAVPAAAPFILATAAAVGVYEGIANGIELLNKIADDWRNGRFDDWFGGEDFFEDLINLFNPRPIDPLVIDLDDDGVELTSLNGSSAFFDLDGDGFAERTGWVNPDDALLVIDTNANGKIDDITELFGSNTQSGYAELAVHDGNGDGRIDAQDAVFSSLQIWQDFDGDGVSTPDELRTAEETGIVSFGLNATKTNKTVNGNAVIEKATVEFQDGTTHETAEVLFSLSQAEATYNLPDNFIFDDDVFNLPQLHGAGEIPNLWVGMTNDSILKDKAEALISTMKTEGISQFMNDFDDFLAQWAGVPDAVWSQDTTNSNVLFVYHDDEISEYYNLKDAGGNPEAPAVQGYVFVPGAGNGQPLSESEIQAWATENGYTVPGLDIDQSTILNDFSISQAISDMDFSHVPNSRLQPRIGALEAVLSDSEVSTPGISATTFAFIQKMMGQEYRIIDNVIAPEHLLVLEPDTAAAEQILAVYQEVKEHTLSRFLAQAAHSSPAEAGENASLGDLAPFSNIFLDPFTGELEGNAQALVDELIQRFPNGEINGIPASLEILSWYEQDFPHLAALVATSHPEFTKEQIIEAFDIEAIDEGTAANDSLNSSYADILLGHEGDDTLSGSDASLVFGGGLGADTLNGSNRADTYIYRLGDGNDVINDHTFSNYEDRLIFTDVDVGDVSFSQNAGKDLIISLSNGETVTITDHFDGTAEDMELIEFADGTFLDAQAIRNKSISDQKASGTVQGSEHTEIYSHSFGDGSYTIKDFSYRSVDDRLVFADLNVDEVNFSHNVGKDLVITMSNGEAVKITDHFDGNFEDMELIEFADGTALDAQGIRNKSVADQKISGSGTVRGSEHVEIYYHAFGDGSYVINDFSYGGALDRLIFTDVNADDVSFFVNEGLDLEVKLSNGETITITDHFDGTQYSGKASGSNEDMERIEFSDGTVLNQEAIKIKVLTDTAAQTSDGDDIVVGTHFRDSFEGKGGDDTLSGGLGDDTLNGGEGADTYIYRLGDGNDVINDHTFSNYEDRLIFTDVDVDDVSFSQNAGKDLIISLSNGETVTITDHFDGTAEDMELIEFADGTFLDAQAIRNKSISDQKASGTVQGSEHTEIYSHSFGDGSYTIKDFSYRSVDDRLVFADLNVDEVNFSHNVGKDLVITMSNGEAVKITDHFDGNFEDMELIEFADGTALDAQGIRNKSVADQKISGSGTVRGSEHVEIYYHAFGDGSYVINDFSYGGALDRLIFTDVNADDVSFFVNEGLDLEVKLSNGETITITDHFDGTQYSGKASGSNEDMERIEFSDGTVLNQEAIRNKILTDTAAKASDGDDIIVGTHFRDSVDGKGGDDDLETKGGDDTLSGGLGDDTLDGGEGADTYIYRLGDGRDVINDHSFVHEDDRIVFADLNADDVKFSQNAGKDLVLTMPNGETVKITDHFVVIQGNEMELIEFADGTVLGAQAIRDKSVADQKERGGVVGSEYSETYYHTSGDGSYTITDQSYLLQPDTLVFTDISEDEVLFWFADWNSDKIVEEFKILLPEGEIIFISKQLVSTYHTVDPIYWGVEKIVFADGTNLDAEAAWEKANIDFITMQVSYGDDVVSGRETDDVIDAGEGNDTINGGAGNDSYLGGAGDDVLIGSAGSDVFDGGDGIDTLDLSASDDHVTVDISQSSIQFTDGTTEQIINVENVIAGSGNSTITGSDADNRLIGGAGDDTLDGGNGSDIYVYASGDGNDVINDHSFANNNDRLVFTDENAEAVTFAQNAGKDLVITLSNAETVTISEHFNGTIEDMELIEFADGTVLDVQAIHDKTVADTLAANDAPVAVDDVATIDANGSLLINVLANDTDSDSDSITLNSVTGALNGTAVIEAGQIRYIAADGFHGQEILTYEISDEQGGTDTSTVTIIVNPSVTAVENQVGTSAADVYSHTTGNGSYTIKDFSYSASAKDKLVLTDQAEGDVTFSQTTGDNLLITTAAGEEITIIDHFRDKQYDLEQIEFADGTVLDSQEIRDRTVSEMKGTGTVKGSDFSENYFYSSGDGSYTITDFDIYANSGTDTFTFNDVNSSNVTFVQGASKDLIMTRSDGDAITINNHFDTDGDYALETVTFADGVNLDSQGIRDRSVADMKSSAVVKGSELAENYAHSAGDGSYTITDFDIYANSGTDTFTFNNVNSSDVTFEHGASKDLIMTLSDGEIITINNHFDTDGDYALETVAFADGVNLDSQGIRDRSVADMKSSAVVKGSELAENYAHSAGDGSYTITDFDIYANSGTDVFTFNDAAASEVTFEHGASNDLLMAVNGGDTITINNHFDTDGDYALETVVFADGSILNWDDLNFA